jgi:hypothetical protein
MSGVLISGGSATIRRTAMDIDVTNLLSLAVSDCTSFSNASVRLRKAIPEDEQERYEPFRIALGYDLIERGSDRRDRAGGHFGSMIATAGWQFPPPLDELATDIKSQWDEAIDDLPNPVWGARLGDLLWTTKTTPKAYRRAQRAVSDYLTLSRQELWGPMERVRCATRALELTWELNDPKRRVTAAACILALVDEDLASDSGGPGVTLRLIESLRDPGADITSDQLAELLDRASERYGNDPWIAESIDDVRAEIRPEEQAVVREAQVRRWRDRARDADGLLKAMWLERALDIARRHGLSELADELRVELQGLEPDDLDLKEFTAEVSIPTAEIDAFIQGLVGDDDIDHALSRLGSYPPPGGSREQLRTDVGKLMADHPIQFLFTQVVIGPDAATTIFRADDEAKTLRLALGRQRAQYATFWGHFTADALTEMGERYGPLPPERLTTVFLTPLVDVEIAERLSRALQLFWDGYYDECALVVLPRIEAVIRNLARNLGIPIVHEPYAGRDIGGLSTLGVLLADLEGAFQDDTWRAYLQDLLIDPLSMNLRNELLHGLRARASRSEAALLLHVICWLRLVRLTPREPDAATK